MICICLLVISQTDSVSALVSFHKHWFVCAVITAAVIHRPQINFLILLHLYTWTPIPPATPPFTPHPGPVMTASERSIRCSRYSIKSSFSLPAPNPSHQLMKASCPRFNQSDSALTSVCETVSLSAAASCYINVKSLQPPPSCHIHLQFSFQPVSVGLCTELIASPRHFCPDLQCRSSPMLL